jgi:hypothetical protein
MIKLQMELTMTTATHKDNGESPANEPANAVTGTMDDFADNKDTDTEGPDVNRW